MSSPNKELYSDLKSYLDLCFFQHHHDLVNNPMKKLPDTLSHEVVDGTRPSSTLLCRHSTFLMRYVLQKSFGEKWNVAGGNMKPSDPDSPAQPHYWLENKEGTVLDLTADQFGHESIVISSKDDNRYERIADKCKVSEVSNYRSSALRWLTNDFGFYGHLKPKAEEITKKHQELTEKYPDLKKVMLEPGMDNSPSPQ